MSAAEKRAGPRMVTCRVGWHTAQPHLENEHCINPKPSREPLPQPAPATPETVARVYEECAPLLDSLVEFLAIRQVIIDCGGQEEPLDKEMITCLAKMQAKVVDRARKALRSPAAAAIREAAQKEKK